MAVCFRLGPAKANGNLHFADTAVCCPMRSRLHWPKRDKKQALTSAARAAIAEGIKITAQDLKTEKLISALKSAHIQSIFLVFRVNECWTNLV